MAIFLNRDFKREEHVYRNEHFSELLKDAVRFFHGTPVHPLPPPEAFKGAGVYAIYCIAKQGVYSKFGLEINRLSYKVPIYVGKAVPSGWRQSRTSERDSNAQSLFSRLRQHATSITDGKGLILGDFACRFAIFEGDAVQMIAAVEAAIIGEHTPLWNSVIDGFGNHAPGAKRVSGRVTQWDTLHPGRGWAEKMTGEKHSLNEIKRRVKDYLVGLR